MHKTRGLIFNTDFALGAGRTKSITCCWCCAAVLIPKQKQVKTQVYESLSLCFTTKWYWNVSKNIQNCMECYCTPYSQKCTCFFWAQGRCWTPSMNWLWMLETSIMWEIFVYKQCCKKSVLINGNKPLTDPVKSFSIMQLWLIAFLCVYGKWICKTVGISSSKQEYQDQFWSGLVNEGLGLERGAV